VIGMDISTYEELEKELHAFEKGTIKLMIIEGPGATGKTHTAENIVSEPLITFKGHVTNWFFNYKMAKNGNSKVIIDDVPAFLYNKKNISTLLQICELREENKIYYDTTASYKGKEIPSPYTSKHRLLIIVNKLIDVQDAVLRAMLGRGITIRFNPSRKEIWAKMNSFAKDKEILGFLETFIDTANRFDLRLYKIAEIRKLAGLDWKKYLISEMEIDDKVSKYHELSNMSLSDTEKLKLWPYGRATYYRYKKLYKPVQPK
jgi:hypothetical protein